MNREVNETRALVPRNPLSVRRRNWVTAGILLGIFLAAVEQTVVATAMPTLVASLGGLNIYSWVFSSYLLASTVSVPLWGRLADRHGRKSFYLACIVLFLLGSVLAGQARSMAFLVFARGVQGLGAGGIFPIGSTILSDIYTLETRARIQGIFSSVWGLASIAGPLAGGLITDLLSWRWVFYVNVPFGLAAAFVVGRALTEPARERPRHSIDALGVVSLCAGVTLLLVALILVGEGDRGTSLPWLLFTSAAIALFFFVRLERRAEEPLLPVPLFQNRVFAVSSVLGFFIGMGLFGALSYVPLFVQGVLFGSATRAGTSLTPLMLAWVVLSAASGWMILKFGYRPLAIFGMSCFVLGFALLSRVGEDTTYPTLWLSMGIIGSGMGLSMVTMLLGVQNSVPQRFIATATSATVFFRTIGGTVGVAILGAVLTRHLVLESRSTEDPTLMALAARPDAIAREASRGALTPEALAWLRETLTSGLHAVFLTGLVFAGVAFVVSLTFPRGSARALAAEREGR